MNATDSKNSRRSAAAASIAVPLQPALQHPSPVSHVADRRKDRACTCVVTELRRLARASLPLPLALGGSAALPDWPPPMRCAAQVTASLPPLAPLLAPSSRGMPSFWHAFSRCSALRKVQKVR